MVILTYEHPGAVIFIPITVFYGRYSSVWLERGIAIIKHDTKVTGSSPVISPVQFYRHTF